MPRFLRLALLTVRDLSLTAGPVALLGAALIVAAYAYLDPMPPRVVTLATGPEQSAYAEFGRRYAAWMRQHGIEVRLRGTEGAAENLALLRDPGSGVDVAFVQGGADSAPPPPPGEPKRDGLVALGGVFLEPVWLFYREDTARRLLRRPTVDAIADLRGWRLNVGEDGSGVPNMMDRLFAANRIDPRTIALERLAPTPAVVELLERRIDALVFATAPEAPLVQMLLITPGVRLFDFVHAEAYARRHPFLATVTLPRGLVDLARDVPQSDVRLIAPTAMLLTRERTHPALMQLFVQAAQATHREAGWFQKRGEFPAERALEWPLAREAERTLRDGPPWIQRFLPFWAANLIDRMWLVLLSLVAVLIPLSRVVPPLYAFRVRSRIFRWYGQLREIEDEVATTPDRAALARRLDALDERVEHIAVPLSYADQLYALREHIQLVRRRLVARGAAAGAPQRPGDAAQRPGDAAQRPGDAAQRPGDAPARGDDAPPDAPPEGARERRAD